MEGLFQCPPWAMSFWAFSPYLNHVRNFSNLMASILFYLPLFSYSTVVPAASFFQMSGRSSLPSNAV